MAIAMLSLLLAIPLLGVATGMRSMTPIAVLCWFAHFNYLSVQGTWAFWTAHIASVAIFTVFALGEYVADKLPSTPNRTAPGPLAVRLIFGGLCGAIAATAIKAPGLEGAVLGIVGAAVGSFGGYIGRREVVQKIGYPDWTVAMAGDFATILVAVFALHILTN
jgi:uncharacterized membrane protein